MKNFFVGSLAALGLLAGVALLETPAFPQPGPARPGAQHMLQAIAAQLELTDAQKTQAHQIFQDAHAQAQPVLDQLKTGHDAVAAAVKANNTGQIDSLTAQQGALMGKLASTHARAMAKFYAILTPEQQAKADKLHQFMSGMIASHFGAGGVH